MTGSRLWKARSDFLYEMSSILLSKSSLPESLMQWKKYANSIEKRWIDRMTYLGETSEELAMSIANAAQLPTSWKVALQRAAAHGRLELMLACIADECEREANLAIRTTSSVYASIGVFLFAWIGILVMVSSTVPAIDSAFQVLHQEPTWWLVGYRILYDSRWIWFFGVPGFMFLGFSVGYGKRVKAKERAQLSLAVYHALQRIGSAASTDHLDSLQQSSERFLQSIMDEFPDKVAVDDRQRILRGFDSEREASKEEWRIQRLAIRFSLLATILVVTVYLAIGILPLIWLVRTQLGQTS